MLAANVAVHSQAILGGRISRSTEPIRFANRVPRVARLRCLKVSAQTTPRNLHRAFSAMLQARVIGRDAAPAHTPATLKNARKLITPVGRGIEPEWQGSHTSCLRLCLLLVAIGRIIIGADENVMTRKERPTREQQKIAGRANAAAKCVAALEKALRAQERVKLGLQRELLMGRGRVGAVANQRLQRLVSRGYRYERS